MTRAISAEIWRERARSLNLEWVNETPKRNDQRELIRCLDCGSEWFVIPANIAKGRKSCEPCARQASRVSNQEWVERLSEVNAEWLGQTPANIADKSQLARCRKCGESWAVNPRRIAHGHPRCLAKAIKPTVSSQEWLIRAQKAQIKWLQIPVRSKEKVEAQCLRCNHIWKPIPDNIRGGSGCPSCAIADVARSTRPKVSPEEWDRRASTLNLRWTSPPPKSAKTKSPIECIVCGHTWFVLPSNITKGAGCPACAGNAPVAQSVWDQRALAAGLEWLEPVLGRHSNARARCLSCGHIWSPEAGSVAGGAGCPACSEEKRRKSRLLGNEAWIARAAKAELSWIEIPDNNSSKRLIHCDKCSYEWSVIPATIASGAGCPICAGVSVQPETWKARALAVGIEWLDLPTSARRPTKARCLKCGLTWNANPGGVTSGSGCPDCAETGYKVGQPGLFYLVERKSSQGRPARKIGITNVSSAKTRLSLWRNQGFLLRMQKVHDDGQLILNLETNMLRWLRFEMNLPQYLDKEEMPRGGATETFSPDDPSDSVLLKKIESEFSELVGKYDLEQ
jgi:predicted  nucleic acid-binding Zn-ribbon protein